MNNENKDMLLELRKEAISKLTEKLNIEVARTKLYINEDVLSEILANCKSIMNSLNAELTKLHETLLN